MMKAKARWITEVYDLLCRYQGGPENDADKHHMRAWAENIYDFCETDARESDMPIITPKEAVEEELSCGQ